MRILVASLGLETNTFTPVVTHYDDFRLERGPASLQRIAAVETFQKAGCTVIPSISADTVPSGPIDPESFARFCDEILAAIPPTAPGTAVLDGVWLNLHGAMEVLGQGSGEERLLRVLRDALGFEVPIAVALDFHANNTPAVAELANIVCGYRTAPHTDSAETQIRAAELLIRCIRENLLPHPAMVKPPLLLGGEMVMTGIEPAKSLIDDVRRTASRTDILDAALFCGCAWADVPHSGASVIVTAPERDTAEQEARRLAQRFWDMRREFYFEEEAAQPDEALEVAAATSKGPIFISDSGDNLTAGAPGDSTWYLQRLLDRAGRTPRPTPSVPNGRLPDRPTLVAGILDSAAVQLCASKRPRECIDLHLGGQLNPEPGTQMRFSGTLLQRGCIQNSNGDALGEAVVLRLATTSNPCTFDSSSTIDVVITSKRCAFTDPANYTSLGLTIPDYHLIVVKMGYLFDALRPFAARAILAFTPGPACQDFSQLTFRRVQRPVFPLDDSCEWEASRR